MTTTEEPPSRPVAAPADMAAAATRRGWPDGLLERALGLRVSREKLKRWLTLPWASLEFVQRRLEWHERLTLGTLRGREATGEDNEGFADLFANAPEEVGAWEIITERSPNAFAQFRLQENVNVLVIEDRGVLVAACAFSHRKTFVGGQRLTVRYGQALRVRREYRRQGYGDQVRSLSWGVGAARPSHAQYDLMRSENFAVVGWWKKYVPNFFDNVPVREGGVPGISVTVLQYPVGPFAGDSAGIRKVRPADLARCVGLINGTHRGLDLFRPYTTDYLRNRLDDGYWGDAPDFVGWDWPDVYGWQDYYVLEERGRVVACAGLWDRGRDMRDRWRHKETGERKVISATALLDFGYEAGHEASMAQLIGYLIGETHRLGRNFLLVPLDQFPELAARLEQHEPVPDARALRWDLQEPSMTRPHIDLSYW